MTFIIAEDEALRSQMMGMTVSDSKTPERAVEVWFGQPDQEMRAQSFPFVIIDLIDISEATERVMSGKSKPWYLEPELETNQNWDIWYPTPINLFYQISTFARHPRHDRQILAQILGTRLPLRFGSLVVKQTENDDGTFEGTVRRLDTVNVVKRDTTEGGKRMFMNVFTIRVSSEIPSPYDFQTYYKVMEVRLNTHDNNTYYPFGPGGSIDSVISAQVP